MTDATEDNQELVSFPTTATMYDRMNYKRRFFPGMLMGEFLRFLPIKQEIGMYLLPLLLLVCVVLSCTSPRKGFILPCPPLVGLSRFLPFLVGLSHSLLWHGYGTSSTFDRFVLDLFASAVGYMAVTVGLWVEVAEDFREESREKELLVTLVSVVVVSNLLLPVDEDLYAATLSWGFMVCALSYVSCVCDRIGRGIGFFQLLTVELVASYFVWNLCVYMGGPSNASAIAFS